MWAYCSTRRYPMRKIGQSWPNLAEGVVGEPSLDYHHLRRSSPVDQDPDSTHPSPCRSPWDRKGGTGLSGGRGLKAVGWGMGGMGWGRLAGGFQGWGRWPPVLEWHRQGVWGRHAFRLRGRQSSWLTRFSFQLIVILRILF